MARDIFRGNQKLTDEANNLLQKLKAGNGNPGKGANSIGNGIFEFRGNTARIYFNYRSDGGINILAYSHKGNQGQVIDQLKRIYKK